MHKDTKKTTRLPKSWQRTPIAYYGGKQSMLSIILPMIPEHTIYVEPFFGGGAVFWAKEPARVEIVNDFNGNVVNFYEVLRDDFKNLHSKITATPYSREVYKAALVVYHAPFVFSKVERAWAFWLCTNMGYSNQVNNPRFDNNGKAMRILQKKQKSFQEYYSERLVDVQIECQDACEVIERFDSEQAFFYCDPPYVGANQGHYGGYTEAHFEKLLETLAGIKGRFLLSSYAGELLSRFQSKFVWNSKESILPLSSSHVKGRKRKEVLTFNYQYNE